jgi:hypothetical protein
MHANDSNAITSAVTEANLPLHFFTFSQKKPCLPSSENRALHLVFAADVFTRNIPFGQSSFSQVSWL